MSGDTLRIAIVRPFLTATKGGAERYAVELIRGLAAAGHQVHAFAHAWDESEQAGVVYNKIAMPRKPGWLRVLRFHFNLRRKLRLSDFDVVLGLTPFSPQHVFWLGDGLYVVWVRIAWPLAPVRWLMCLKRAVMGVNLALEKSALTSATAGFIANSKLVARQARHLYGVPAKQIAVVYPWIDTERFNPAARARWRDAARRQLGIGENEIALLFASNNFKRKGLALVLSALARIDRGVTPLRLIVAGAGAISAFRRQARRLGLGEHTTFLGAVANIERYYAAADMFVLPTRYDPCATVCLEAMACGLPVVTSAMNGAAEFIDEGKTGYTLQTNASADVWAKCITALASHERCSNAGALAYDRVRDLSTAAHLQQMSAALKSFRRVASAPACVQLHPDFIVNEAFLPLLTQHRLTSFSALLAAAKQHEIEYNQHKRIALLALEDDGAQRYFFVKAHRRERGWAGTALARYRQTEGVKEWRNILALQSAGIPTASPVAAGERVISDGGRESFVMTLRLDGYLPLDRFIAERFVPPYSPSVRREKLMMIRAVADLARRMHAMGFNHQDFYLCHIFARIAPSGLPDLKLIDLQRIGQRRLPKRRWIVKDLAQLYYSSLSLPLTRVDRLRFLVRYAATSSRQAFRRSLLLSIVRKARAIEKHDAKIQAGRPPADRSDPFDVSLRLGQSPSPHEHDRGK